LARTTKALSTDAICSAASSMSTDKLHEHVCAPFTLSIPLFQMTGVLDGQTATAAFAVATGVLGAGAAMLPTGAAAGASARILRSLPDQDHVAAGQRGARNGHSDKTPVLSGTKASNGQMGKSA
jgi:hypothetical protein